MAYTSVGAKSVRPYQFEPRLQLENPEQDEENGTEERNRDQETPRRRSEAETADW